MIETRQTVRDISRAFFGALIFGIPLLMTMEMWWLGFYLEPGRIALFLAALLPLLFGLSRYAGFRETFDWREDTIDTLVAFAVGALSSAVFLLLFAVITPGQSLRAIVGKIALLSVPASIGAILAEKQLGGEANERRARRANYGGELFLMAGGALFLAFNVAPTEEMIVIAYKMSFWHALLLAAASLVLMHAMVYSVGFRGQEVGPEGSTPARLFYRFTVVGYALGLLICVYVLWTFGRFDGQSLEAAVKTTVVLGLPAALGAAVSRLVL